MRLSALRITMSGLLGLSLMAAPALAADESWVAAGRPSGGQIFKVATVGGKVYALANQGVFESSDGGASWSLLFSMNESDGLDLAVDPVHPANIYVAGHDTGLWKSADGGQTWNHLSGISESHVVTVDPVNAGVVYAIANAGFTAGCDVYKSVDGGDSWNLIDTGMSGLTGNAQTWCTRIAVDPANPQQLYLSAQVGPYQGSTGARGGGALSGLYSSTDGGAHWSQQLPTLAFADVVIDPSDDQNIYAGDQFSSDGGATWAPLAGLPANVQGDGFTVIAVDPADSQHLWGVAYAGIEGALWSSADQGATWNPVTMPQSNAVYNLSYDPATPGTLYAASMAFGVYKSSDDGSTWKSATDGIAGVFPFDILVDSTGDVYMGTEGTGVFKSRDGGKTWAMKDDGIAVNIGTSGITAHQLIDTHTSGTLYMTDQHSLYKTTDGGDHWADIGAGSVGGPDTVAVDPQQAETVYAGTGNRVMKSIDGGATWSGSSNGLHTDAVWTLAVARTDSKVVFAGGFSTGLFKSSDGGATWSEADRGMPVAFGIGCVAVDPTTAQTVYACPGNAGIYKSTDGGDTWSKAGDLPNFAFQILKIDPNDADVIYAAIPDLGVYVSTDAGATWNRLDDPASSTASHSTEALVHHGSPSGAKAASASQPVRISEIAVDPRHARHLYGAADDAQVYTLGVTAGDTGSNGSSSSSSGGGDLSLLMSALLLGFAARRRKH